jgi:hypothetical protein
MRVLGDKQGSDKAEENASRISAYALGFMRTFNHFQKSITTNFKIAKSRRLGVTPKAPFSCIQHSLNVLS